MLTDPEFSKLRLLVHVHIYHVQHYPELRQCLENLKGLNFDLFVSMSADHPEIADNLRVFKPDAVIFRCPNRGFDVAPFVDVLNRVNLDKYDLVVKLHTKRDTPADLKIMGTDVCFGLWREKLLSFIKNKKNLEKSLHAFMTDPKLGMAAHHSLIVWGDTGSSYYGDCEVFLRTQKFLNDLLHEQIYPQDHCIYVAGTMFLARAKIFKSLKDANLGYEHFMTVQATKEQNDCDLAHMLERGFGWLITSAVNADGMHYEVRDCFSSKHSILLNRIHKHFDDKIWYPHRYIRKFGRFILRHEYVDNGRIMHIKLFKKSVIALKIRN